MGIKDRMTEVKQKERFKFDEATLYALNERNARADRLVEKWSRMPEIGTGMKAMDPRRARNLAILLENEARHLKSLTEAQYSSAFATTPENMIRLVRLAYPNSVRDKIFTDFAMETAKDSIKYIKPIYSSNSNINRSDLFGGAGTGFNNNITYESMQSRFPIEIANATVAAGTGGDAGKFIITCAGGEFGANGVNLIDGYTTLYDANGNALAVQTKPGEWLQKYPTAVITGPDANGVYKYTPSAGGEVVARATARYNSEIDLQGTYLGEVELVMTDYQFKIRPISLGVTWTTMSELVLDSTVGVSAEETLFDAAAQEIKKALDFHAVKYGYAVAQTNGVPAVTFNAEAGGTTKDSYIHTAQTISQAIERVGDQMFNTINRGGVSRIVGGPAAVTYLRLNAGFTTNGAQPRIGIHQVGELYGIPVFKAPSSIIPDNTLMCVWKNDTNEADVAIAFGTLVPFFSTGAIQRKNFYKEAGLASFGDYKALNPKYLGLITISNLRQIS